MNINKVKEWFFFSIPSESKKRFKMEVRTNNLIRSKVTSFFFLTMELMMLPIMIIAKKSAVFDYPNYLYVSMYLLMIVGILIFLFAMERLKKDLENTVKYKFFLYTYTVFLLSWCAMISLLDQMGSGQIIVYMVATVCIAIFPLYETHTLLPIYAGIHILFLILLPVFQESQDKIYENSVNSTVNIIISLIISRYLYKSKLDDFMNKVTIEENNKVLNELNSKLLEVNQQLEQLSITDSLTGLLNRRKFDELVESNWEISRKNSIPMSIIMMDVDMFKQYNDCYGHQVGDNCIISIANTISKLLRPSVDFAARYGGDEYILLLTDTAPDQAYEIAETLRKKIGELKIPFNDNEDEYVTVSLGVCSSNPKQEKTIKEIISAADRALYQAKSQNRNNSVVYII